MFTDYTPQDALRLQQARLARFRSFVLTNLDITIDSHCLTLAGTDPNIVIAQANTWLHQAAIILGTSKLQILDTSNNVIFTAELKSEHPYTTEDCYMTAATAQRAVEFEVESKQELIIVAHNQITKITNETEQELRDRLKARETPFYWAEETWGVDADTASQLIIDFRTKQAQREVEMLFSPTEVTKPKSVASKSEEEVNGHKPKAEKPEFQPLKRGATATLEKYLKFVAADNETRQTEILSDLAEEGIKGKRHVNKILGSYPDDMKKPKASEFYVAASKLLAKRDKVQPGNQEDKANDEQTEETAAE